MLGHSLYSFGHLFEVFLSRPALYTQHRDQLESHTGRGRVSLDYLRQEPSQLRPFRLDSSVSILGLARAKTLYNNWLHCLWSDLTHVPPVRARKPEDAVTLGVFIQPLRRLGDLGYTLLPHFFWSFICCADENSNFLLKKNWHSSVTWVPTYSKYSVS